MIPRRPSRRVQSVLPALLFLFQAGCSQHEHRESSVEERRHQALSAARGASGPGSEAVAGKPAPPRPSSPASPAATAVERDPSQASPSRAAEEGAQSRPPAPSNPAHPPGLKERPGKNSEVEKYLFDLQATPEVADKAFHRLWEVPARLIPALILEVDNPAPSAVKELAILVLDKEAMARLDDATGSFTYHIRGMGNLYFDEIAVGKTRSGRGLRVKLTNIEGFPVGIVLRAALLNRFRSTEFPANDDRVNPVGWWQSFYRQVRSKL